MEYQISINPLYKIAEMGFAVTWKLIGLGLDKSLDENIDPYLNEEDTVRFLKDVLGNNLKRTDEIIAILCEDDDPVTMRKKIRELAQIEPTDQRVQLRKWRAYALQELLKEIKGDPLGHCELNWFWSTGLSIGDRLIEDYGNDPVKIRDFYSPQGAERTIRVNEEFLAAEIKELSAIGKFENDMVTVSRLTIKSQDQKM
ncbi:MAG: DUF2247 family protein [Clostridia bacterium]|nr:DUF2247 family protein [Clostridia bacterium]